MRKLTVLYAAAIATAAIALSGHASAANLLSNAAYNVADPGGATDSSAAGPSAAANWTVYVAPNANVKTELVASDQIFPRRLGKMIHVTVNGFGGLVQTFLPENSGPQVAFACAWIKVVRGSVGLGLGNGGNTSLTAHIGKTGRWERLETSNGVAPANEIIVYSTNWDGAEYYVESAYIGTTRAERACACAAE